MKHALAEEGKLLAVNRRTLREFADVRTGDERFFSRAGEDHNANGRVVEAASRFAAVPAGEDHAFKQRRRGEAALAEFVEHDIRNVIGGVETHEIEQRERTHGMPAAKLHGIVDVFNGADALFKGAYGVEQVRDEEAIDDEAGAVVGAHRRFAELYAQRNHF